MEPEPAKTLAVNVTQEGSVVLVDAQQKCALRRYDKIETTDHSTAVNKQPWVDWTLGVSGGTLLAIGGWTFADASNVYPDDTSSRTYNRVGPSTAKGIGVGTMVTGGALLGVAVVDALRAQGTTDGDPTVHERKGDLAGKCPSTPVAGVQIIGRFTQGGGNPITLGTTSSEGALELNLSEVPVPPNPPGDTDGEPYGPTLDVYVGDKIVGKVGLASVYPTWRQAWQSERVREAEQAAETARERARQRHTEAMSALAEVERALGTLDTNQWTDEKVALFGNLATKLKMIASTTSQSGGEFTEAELRRVRAVHQKIEHMLPSWEKARTAARARAQAAAQGAREQARREAIAIGRTYIQYKVRSPSTLQFVGDGILLECPNGFVTVHEFDAQNGFGAMIRNRWAILQNKRSERIDHSDCINARFGVLCIVSGDATRDCAAKGLQ
jgi:hypothetical protein